MIFLMDTLIGLMPRALRVRVAERERIRLWLESQEWRT